MHDIQSKATRHAREQNQNIKAQGIKQIIETNPGVTKISELPENTLNNYD